MAQKKNEKKALHEYNSTLFNSIENAFVIFSSWYGEDQALSFLSALMSRNLGSAYRHMGAKELGGADAFRRYALGHDASLGIESSLSEIGPDKFSYKVYTDVFPALKGKVDPQRLDDTYIRYKVHFFMGPEWTYSTTKHIWKGDEYTSYTIRRKRI